MITRYWNRAKIEEKNRKKRRSKYIVTYQFRSNANIYKLKKKRKKGRIGSNKLYKNQ